MDLDILGHDMGCDMDRDIYYINHGMNLDILGYDMGAWIGTYHIISHCMDIGSDMVMERGILHKPWHGSGQWT